MIDLLNVIPGRYYGFIKAYSSDYDSGWGKFYDNYSKNAKFDHKKQISDTLRPIKVLYKLLNISIESLADRSS